MCARVRGLPPFQGVYTVSGKRKSLDRCRVTVDLTVDPAVHSALLFTSLLCDTDKRKTHAHDTVHMLSSLSVSPPGTHPLPRGGDEEGSSSVNSTMLNAKLVSSTRVRPVLL